MAETQPPTASDTPSASAAPAVAIRVAPSPHLCDAHLTTRGMMIDVLVGLAPVLVMAVLVFHWYAVVQVGLCVLSCLVAEVVFTRIRRKPIPIGDYSAAVTGVILGLSLPWGAPWYIGVLGSVVAIGLGKVVFGGLGFNIFNPAMVGRAFVMLSFAKELGASAYVVTRSNLEVLTQATPLTIAKQFAADLAAGKVVAFEQPVQLEHAKAFWPLFIGQVNGSPGETSALALLVGGIYLCIRRAAAWQIPAGIFLTTVAFAAAAHGSMLTPFNALHHLISGSVLFGAFFIATDPVTSPVTSTGKFLFGLGIGLLVVLVRVFSGYPEGVMFAVLVMNAVVPLINRWTIPRPLGGPVPRKD
ncbi:MAG: RnfABCDGE type electron transport complex subunit D [Pirellulales bacterium]|nr:RnfABCDGE type electron transport complex subunit D [Pirellulales bacterium]